MPRRRAWRRCRRQLPLFMAGAALFFAITEWWYAGFQVSRLASQVADVSGALDHQVVALGVRWSDEQGPRYHWAGTGFVLETGGWCGTAGHVVQELVHEANDLERRGLRPVIVGDFPDGSVRELVNLSLYAGLPDDPNSVPGRYDIDLARFRASPPWDKKGLRIAVAGPPSAGGTIIIAGFPTASSAISYPTGPALPERLIPTIRIGHLERVSGLDTRPSSIPSLLQHDVGLVGGFSGAPLVGRDGRLLGIVTVSSHVQAADSLAMSAPTSQRVQPHRVLDAGGFNFAISAIYFETWR